MENRFIISNKSTDVATIDIDGYIGWDWENTPEDANAKAGFKARLKEIADLQTKKIIVNIDSLGGSLFDGISIHDILVSHPAEIIVNIWGMTASAATIIAMAGDMIRMSDNALLLVHRSLGIAMGNVNDFEVAVEDHKKYDERIANIYAKRSGKSVEFHLEQMDKNNGAGEWLTPDQAKEMGYVDEVFEPESKRVAASVKDLTQYNLPIPEILKKENDMDEVKNMIEGLKTWLKDTFSTKGEVVDETRLFDQKVQEIEARYTDYEGKITEKDSEITDLKSQVDAVTQERDALQAEVSALRVPPIDIKETDPPIEGEKTKEHPFDAVAREMKKSMIQ